MATAFSGTKKVKDKSKIKKWSDFEGFSIDKWGGNQNKFAKFLYLVFERVAKYTKGWWSSVLHMWLIAIFG
jgi:hypothetical protein